MIPLVLILGESNAVGYGSVATMQSGESTVSPNMLGYGLNTGSFATMTFGDATVSNQGVGFEIAMNNAVKAGTFPKAYMMKYGVGGTRISQWVTGGEYNVALFQYLNAVKTKMTSLGEIYQPFIWYSQGINDFNAGTPANTWVAKTTEHFGKFRDIFPNAWIYTTELPPGYNDYDLLIKSLSVSIPGVRSVSSLSAELNDTAHWSTNGYRLIGERMVARTVTNYGQSFVSLTSPSSSPILFFFGL